MKKYSIYTVLLCLLHFSGEAQVLYNNNSNVFVSNGALLQVNGTAQNAGGTVENNGTSNILIDYVNDDQTQGNGTYNVTGNWENNGVFTPQTSHVFLDGVNQLITGTQVTSFYDLSTTGTGIKTQTIDARVLNILDLTDRELATDASVMFVDNTNINAITFTTGFVSSDQIIGQLDRATNSTGVYIFPTGSSIGTLRYRPIEITPTAGSSNRYTVRFANVDATTEGFDRNLKDTSICLVNPNWYHLIGRSLGTENADVTIYFDQPTDGAWDGIGQWEMATTNLWENVGAVTAGAGVPMESLTKSANTIWTSEPFALTNPTPTFDFTGTDPVTCGIDDGELVLTNLTPNTVYDVSYDVGGATVGPVSLTSDASGNITIAVGSGTFDNVTVDDGSCTHTNTGSLILNGPTGFTSTFDNLVDESACGTNDGTLTFTGFVPGTSYAIDYDESLGGTTNVNIVADASGEITITGLSAQDYSNFVFDDGACSSTDAGPYTITPGANPSAPVAGTDATYCDGEVLTDLTATPAVGGAINWFDDAGLANNVGIGNTLTPANTTTTYYVTETVNGCQSLPTTVTVTVNPAPVISAEASTDVTDCITPDGSITITSTGTSFELFDISGATTGITNATGSFTGLNAGSYYVIATIGTCTIQSSDFILANPGAPIAPVAGTDADYCDGDVITDINATASAGGTINWYSDAGLTTNVGTGTTLSPANTTGTYYATETTSGCESAATPVTITVNTMPSAPVAGTDATYCDGDVLIDLTAAAGSGGVLNWFDDVTLLNNVGTGTTLTPSNTTTTYYVTESLATCESASSMVTVTVNPSPTITAESSTDITDCTSDNGSISITANGANYELFDATSGTTTGIVNTNGLFSNLSVGSYYVVVSNGTCTTQSNNFVINAAPLPPQPTAGTDATYCEGDVIANMTATGTGGTLNWYTDAGLTNLLGTGTAIQPNNTLGSTTYYVTETINNCTSLASSVTITISPNVNVTLTGVGPYCANDPGGIIIADVPGGAWTGTGVDPNTGVFDPAVSGPGTFTITYTVGGACGDVESVVVTVFDLPAVDAGLDVTILEGESTPLLATGGTTYSWSPSTTLDCNACDNPVASPNVSTEYIVETIDVNGCSNQDSVTVFVVELEKEVFVPNIFSPNGDGLNDYFKIEGTNMNNFSVKVFNRWGEMVFSSTSQNVSWDGTQKGKDLSSNVFVYVLSFTDALGIEHTQSGNVTLVR